MYMNPFDSRRSFPLLPAILFLSLWSCAVGPEYERPETVVEAAESYRRLPDDVGEVVDAGDLSRWWERMDDPWMARHVDRLLTENLRLKEAAARVEQAWARLGIRRGDQLPTLSASASAARRMQPVDGIAPAAGAGGGTGGTEGAGGGPAMSGGTGRDRLYTTRFEVGLSTRWQVDLFGKLRRRTAAARDRFLASRADAQALVHSLIAELARRRIGLSTLKRRLQVARETVESRKMTLDTVDRRYRRGLPDVSADDVYLARENLAAAKADLPDLRRRLMEEGAALDVLLGWRPGTLDPLAADIPLLPPPRPPAVGVPAALLDRRPDLRSSELRLMAATEEIGVAVADLYPDLTLSGNIGFQNDDLRNFFNASNLAGAILGDLMVRLFEGGRLRANIDLQEAEAREAAAAYARQVLNGLEEVEVALGSARFLSRRVAALADRLENIRRAEREARERYRRGLRSLLEVLEIERRRYAAEQAYLLAAQAAWNNRIDLYLALGGDWLPAGTRLHLAPLAVEDDA
jgi:NodT family efflux transporter outer membrane factor (OMF) lipoprotein